LSASIFSDKVWKVLEQGTDENGVMGHGWTYSAHPIGAAAAVANLKLIDSLGLVENAGTVGDYLNAAMQKAVGDHANVGEVRGIGMLCAVELIEDRATRKPFAPVGKMTAAVVAQMARDGVIARAMPQGDIIGFAPPLCLTHAEADQVVAATAAALKKVLG
jgi:L-2,4-diaminobutyrate transaminase